MSDSQPIGAAATCPALPRRSYALTVAIAIACATVLTGLALLLRVGLIDDSYIFLRYARHFAEGNGLVFNVGERVEGFSSPLWTLLLGSAGAVWPRFEILAQAMGLACGAIAITLIVSHARTFTRLGRGDLIILGLGLATSPALVIWSASGMDAALFLLLVSACLVSAVADRRGGCLSLRSAVLLTMAAFARSEGVILVVYIGAYFVYERRSIRVLWGCAIAIAGLFLARFAYYGAWVPNTYHAKVTFDLSRRLSDGAAYVFPAMWTHGVLLAVTCGVLVSAFRRRLLRGGPFLFLVGWGALWTSYVIYVGGDNFSFFRFLLPAVPAFVLLFAYGWSAIRPHVSGAARIVCPIAMMIGLAIAHTLTYRTQFSDYSGDQRLCNAWAKVGRWLEHETPPDAVIATIVPGALGYFSRRPVIDMLGLTDRHVAMYGDIFPRAVHGHARYDTDYLFQRHPDIVVYHSSGRFTHPVYSSADRIPVAHGYALRDFVNDARCAERYEYDSVRLSDGTWIEMQRKRVRIANHEPPLQAHAFSKLSEQ